MSKIGRNAGTGRFTTVKTAKGATHVVETIKKSKCLSGDILIHLSGL